MQLKSKDLLGLRDIGEDEIYLILDTAESFKEVLTRPIKKLPTLRGKTCLTLFYEPSTRTRSSFELAAKYLGADTLSVSASTSSVVKGESLYDTAKTVEAMGVDIIVIRHSAAGAPEMLSKIVRSSVVNAGDGAHEHPTQALLDLFTIREKKGRIEGLKVAIIGDILHSRVARSNIYGLTKLGAQVVLAGPATLLPPQVERLGAEVTTDMKEAITDADVVYMLRIQRERQKKGLFPSIREYTMLYRLDKEKLKLAKEDALVMHPGPINRGIEISAEVADGSHSVITEQVHNGVAIRMSILYLVGGGASDVEKGG